jgi:hypothetical protein
MSRANTRHLKPLLKQFCPSRTRLSRRNSTPRSERGDSPEPQLRVRSLDANLGGPLPECPTSRVFEKWAWQIADAHRWAFLFRHHRGVRRVTAPTPQPLRSSQFFSSHFSRTLITDMHPQSVRRCLDSALSRTVPVSRDGPIFRPQTFHRYLTTYGPGQHPRKCTPNSKIQY